MLEGKFNYLSWKLEEYFENLSSKTPTPGGGSVAGVTGALSSALLSMVGNFTVGKKKYKEYEEEIKELLCENGILRKKLENYIEKDSEIYQNIMKYTKENPSLAQKFLKESANLHLDIAKSSLRIIRWNGVLVEKGNRNLISDVGISAVIAIATFYSAKINAWINMKYIEDEDFCKMVCKEFEEIEKEVKEKGKKVFEDVMKMIERR